MIVYQNFACPYERAEDATFVRNEAHPQLQIECSALTSGVPLPSVARQRINHYETDSLYVWPITDMVLFWALLTSVPIV